MKPEISIVTVCYNNALLLEETVRSILDQKGPSVELVVIDGASTDETPKVLERYRAHIDTIVSEPDDGIYDAMNKGIAHAKGNYIIFINAGDTLCDEAIVKIKPKLAAGLDVFYYGYYNFIIVKGQKLMFRGPVCEKLSREIPTCHNAMIIAKAAFDSCGIYNTNYKLCADYEWLCRNANHLKVKYCREVIVNVLLGGVSELKNLKVLREKVLIAKKYFGIIVFMRHLLRFIRILPISLLKQMMIAAGFFDKYIIFKHKLTGIKIAD